MAKTVDLGLSLTHTHTLPLSHTHTHIRALSLSHTHARSLSLSHTHTHSLSLSLSHTHTLPLFLSLTHTHTLLYRQWGKPSGLHPVQPAPSPLSLSPVSPSKVDEPLTLCKCGPGGNQIGRAHV